MNQQTMSQKSILITGCSTGIGHACAIGLQQRGYRVFATARKPADIKQLEALGLETLMLDYASSASVQACAAEVAKRTGGKLFALFNNGAYGQPGAVEDLTRQALEQQFASNFFGYHELTTLCLPMMRNLGEGRVVQCSSVLGLLALKWRGAYNASKFALEGLSDTMRLELKPFNIKVITINPGPIESRFTQNALAAFDRNIAVENSHYAVEYAGQRKRLERGGKGRFKLPADAVLEKLILALEKPNPRAHYYVTTPTYVVAAARRFLPQGLLDKFADRNSK